MAGKNADLAAAEVLGPVLESADGDRLDEPQVKNVAGTAVVLVLATVFPKAAAAKTLTGSGYITIANEGTQPLYFGFSNASSPTISAAARDATAGRCWVIPANGELHRTIPPGKTKLVLISTSTGTVARVAVSSFGQNEAR